MPNTLDKPRKENSCQFEPCAQAVPYIVYESAQARHERTIKRLIIGFIIAAALVFASNIAWGIFFTRNVPRQETQPLSETERSTEL